MSKSKKKNKAFWPIVGTVATLAIFGMAGCGDDAPPNESKEADTPAVSYEEFVENIPVSDVTTTAEVTTSNDTQAEPIEPEHVHVFADATCTSPKTCSCGATEGDALEHKWEEATCAKPKTCSVCGATDGDAIGHMWEDATCTKPKTCSVCDATDGKALNHDWNDATCKAPKTCSVCGKEEGKFADHKWKKATCDKPKTCSVCGKTEGSALGHDWQDATYASPKRCNTCDSLEGSPLETPGKENYHGHVYTGGDSSVKFHYESECAGKYSHEITWAEVDRRGLGPCGTCVLK